MTENTHAGKAASYDIGRPDYPEAFFEWLYAEAKIAPDGVIADIGCGTDKVARHFLERGNPMFAIEPDPDMLRIADEKLRAYPNYRSFQRSAEDTGLESGSADLIFCGNSYYWFDRKLVVPEFRRISRGDGLAALAWLGGGENQYDRERNEIYSKYPETPTGRVNDKSQVFAPGAFIEKIFDYSVAETVDEFLNGALSEAGTPNPGDARMSRFATI